jgi:hypothetical protein
MKRYNVENLTKKACVAAHLNTPAAAPVLAGAAPKPNAAPVLPPACHTTIYAKSKERHTMPKRVFAGAPAVHSNHPPVCARMACVKSSVFVFIHIRSLKMVIIDANFLKLSRIPCISASSGCMSVSARPTVRMPLLLLEARGARFRHRKNRVVLNTTHLPPQSIAIKNIYVTEDCWRSMYM